MYNIERVEAPPILFNGIGRKAYEAPLVDWLAIRKPVSTNVLFRGNTDYMAAVIPGAVEIILPNVSHFAMLQAPDEYSQGVLEFIDK